MTDEIALAETPDSIEADLSVQEEKMIPASRVEELIKKAKLKGRDAMQDEIEGLRAENMNLKQNAMGMGGMAQPIDTESIRKQVYDQIMNEFNSQNERRAQEEMEREAKKVADDYHSRMKTGQDMYEDFSDVMADFNPGAFPSLVYMATQMDNTPAVMYELMKNPSKLATLAVLSDRDPDGALRQMSKLSASIKANEQAKAMEKEVQSPISRMQSSPVGRDDGNLSLNDMKRLFRT